MFFQCPYNCRQNYKNDFVIMKPDSSLVFFFSSFFSSRSRDNKLDERSSSYRLTPDVEVQIRLRDEFQQMITEWGGSICINIGKEARMAETQERNKQGVLSYCRKPRH